MHNFLAKEFPIEESGGDQLEEEDSGDTQDEVPMFSFMMEGIHTEPDAEGTCEQSGDEEIFFRDTPAMFFSGDFIMEAKEEREEINGDQIRYQDNG